MLRGMARAICLPTCCRRRRRRQLRRALDAQPRNRGFIRRCCNGRAGQTLLLVAALSSEPLSLGNRQTMFGQSVSGGSPVGYRTQWATPTAGHFPQSLTLVLPCLSDNSSTREAAAHWLAYDVRGSIQ